MELVSSVFNNAVSNPTVAICRTAQITGGVGAVAAIVMGYYGGEVKISNPAGLALVDVKEAMSRADDALRPAKTLLVSSLILLGLGTAFFPTQGLKTLIAT
jgi:hypothetical protein